MPGKRVMVGNGHGVFFPCLVRSNLLLVKAWEFAEPVRLMELAEQSWQTLKKFLAAVWDAAAKPIHQAREMNAFLIRNVRHRGRMFAQ